MGGKKNMEKITGIFLSMLLITSALPTIGVIDAYKILNEPKDDYNNIIPHNFDGDYWTEKTKLLASDGESQDYFGTYLSIYENFAIIGAYRDDDNGIGSGSAYIFYKNDLNWTEHAKLLASDGSANDNFGSSVSIYGEYAIIGAPGDNVYGASSGSAYVFHRSGNTWIQQAKLIPSDGETNDHFGHTVCIYGDYAFVGAPRDEFYMGSAYVFHRSGTSWIQQSKLIASDGQTLDLFGVSVSLDGDYAVIGSSLDDDNGDRSGSAFVFHRSGSTWSEQAKLLASDGESDDEFGFSASIKGDYIIVGAWAHNNGSAYIYKRSGTSWSQQTKLIASDGSSGDYFGYSVSIDENYVAIGAPGYNNDMGAVYVFNQSGGIWSEQEKLLASDGEDNDHFGSPVSLYTNLLLISAAWSNPLGPCSGSAYVFAKFSEFNNPPYTPGNLYPLNGAINCDIDIDLSWFGGDPDENDTVFYDVYLDANNPNPTTKVSDDQTETTFDPGTLDYSTTYYWKVHARDSYNYVTKGPIWHFTTREFENQPPNTPEFIGPTLLKIKEEGTFVVSTIDPENDKVYFYIDWGDGYIVNWDGPYKSEKAVYYNHSWRSNNTYTIKIKAKDTYDAESDWFEYEIKITNPRNRFTTNHPLWHLFSCFTDLFPILRILLQRLK